LLVKINLRRYTVPGVTRAAVMLCFTGGAAGIALGTLVLVSYPVVGPANPRP
jgi:hypothetical protein